MDFFAELPLELLEVILTYLNELDRLNALMTCRKSYSLFNQFSIISLVAIDFVLNHSCKKSFQFLFMTDNADINWLKELTGARRLKFSNGFAKRSFNNIVSNRIARDCIHSNITELIFPEYFIYDIDNLIPDHIEHLTFGKWFNRPIVHRLPSSLITLILGDQFNQSIIIPPNLTHLHLGSKFFWPLDTFNIW
jgi:hypothetical protein